MKPRVKVLCRPPKHRCKHRSGQALIGLLVVVLIGMAIYFLLLGPRQGSDGEVRPSVARQSIDRSKEVGVGSSNNSQIQSAIEIFKQDNDGRAPASLDELKNSPAAKGFPPEMWLDPVTQRPLNYDPATGTVSSPNPNAGRPGAGQPGVSNPATPLIPTIPNSGNANPGDADLGAS
jgi:hypothetical protein